MLLSQQRIRRYSLACEELRNFWFLLRLLRPVADKRPRRSPILQRSASGWSSSS